MKKRYILFCFILFFMRYLCVYYNNSNSIDISKLNNIKSGDIILFSYLPKNNLLKKLGILFGQTIIGTGWTHVGIVHKKNNELFICDVTIKNKNKKMGTGFTTCNDLIDRIKKYDGHVSIKFLNKRLNVEQEQQLTKIVSETNINFVNNLEKHVLFNCLALPLHRNINFYNRTGIFCSEYVAIILKKLGIIKDKINTFCFYPIHFSKDYEKYIFQNGFKYSKEYKIII